MNAQVKLGKRLSEIARLVTTANSQTPYDEIWDCCCDHGYLGIALLAHFSEQGGQPTQINFVDQVAHITDQLLRRLEQSGFSQYQVVNADVGKLAFDKYKRHCIIIAGVTTTGTLKLLDSMIGKHPEHTLEFILCPTRGQYDLRRYLINQNVHLVEESHIEENSRHYEILHIVKPSKQAPLDSKKVSRIGEFWEKAKPSQLKYLKKNIAHYQQMVGDKGELNPNSALQLYTDMLEKLTS